MKMEAARAFEVSGMKCGLHREILV